MIFRLLLLLCSPLAYIARSSSAFFPSHSGRIGAQARTAPLTAFVNKKRDVSSSVSSANMTASDADSYHDMVSASVDLTDIYERNGVVTGEEELAFPFDLQCHRDLLTTGYSNALCQGHRYKLQTPVSIQHPCQRGNVHRHRANRTIGQNQGTCALTIRQQVVGASRGEGPRVRAHATRH